MSLPNLVWSVTFARLLLGVVILTIIQSPNLTHAQPPGEAASADAEPVAEEESVRPSLDLGKFKINDLRPTRNETAKLTFTLHLAFSKDLTEAQITQLERWKHRLRDQVITAIRITPTKDFQEPDLNHLRRKILNRVNRLFQANLAKEVLLTEYLFRTH